MNRALGRRRLAALGLAAALGACSSPSPALYTIAPIDGAVQNGAHRVVVLQQVTVARYLERSQIVRSSENYRLDVMANDWWGEPLTAMLGRVLALELGQRLPSANVLLETGAVSASPDATIALNVERLDQNAAGVVVLQAQASISIKGRSQPLLRSFRITAPRPTPDIQGEVAAISAAVGQLADGLATMLARS